MTDAVRGSGEAALRRPEGGPGGAPLAVPNALGALWAVRHGQSTANVAFAEAERAGAGAAPLEGRDRDVPLSALGRAQARALGQWLVERAGDLDLVVCSPYVRAGQTWQVMAGYAAGEGAAPLPLLVDERLRDREMGVFELYPPAALLARAPEEAARRDRLGEWFYRPPGGESLADVALRVRGFLADLERAARGRRVLLVAHDAVVVAVRFALAGVGAAAPEDVPPVPNASLSHWQGDGRCLSLRLWGGTAHLERDGTA
ncbi:histidine phosphatase family protein [Streptomyces sp. SID9727]|uniref:histidine phosphatase family protein n=1 Tax=Streptomyces sp. SID9727 TaxID=2706114 RepID=UPI0013C9CD01|nr:histidine phosphatase family protein [Streptomyces sp. SID9727]NEC63952.1 histidine phosphatase family protein [Streptomyces sp. SID9727]